MLCRRRTYADERMWERLSLARMVALHPKRVYDNP